MFFFFNDTATTEIYTLSLHDALPISDMTAICDAKRPTIVAGVMGSADSEVSPATDRKSTRLNSSHGYISYAVFCLKKKKFFPAPNKPANTISQLNPTTDPDRIARPTI